MPDRTATALASPNIALIKYWGNRDERLRLPASPSISFNLAELHTRTTVTWDETLREDRVFIGGQEAAGEPRSRVARHLDHVRALAGHGGSARVESISNFPAGAGIASSASAFAALSLAAAAALGLVLSERDLSTLARLGSGSAARSIPGGFVAWYAADSHPESYAETFAPPDYWLLVDLVTVVSREHKKVGSTSGHALAGTSPFQAARIASAPERFDACKQAVLARDFAALARVVELDNNLMHGVMMTSDPPLFYWQPATLTVMESIRHWRQEDGLDVCYTIDAGPNVHAICAAESAGTVEDRLRMLPGVLDVLRATPGGPARLVARP